MKYKIGKGENIIKTFFVDSIPVYIVTRCLDGSGYVVYTIDKNGDTKKFGKGKNPLVIEEKYFKSKGDDKNGK